MKKISFIFTFILCFNVIAQNNDDKVREVKRAKAVSALPSFSLEGVQLVSKTAQEALDRKIHIYHDLLHGQTPQEAEINLQKSSDKAAEKDDVTKSFLSSFNKNMKNSFGSGLDAASKAIQKNNCSIQTLLSTNSGYFSKSCNQLDGAIVNTEGSEVLSLSKVFLNNSIDVLRVAGNKEECEKCFKNKVEDTKEFKVKQDAIAKKMILSLKEKELEKEVFNLASVMESMAKQNAIRGSSIQFVLDKKFSSNFAERKEQENQLNCRSINVIKKMVKSKCGLKSINVDEVLSKVLPGNQDHKTGTFMDKLYSNSSNLKSSDSLCESGFKSIGNYQKVLFSAANDVHTDSSISMAKDSFHSLLDKIASTEKATNALCNSSNSKNKIDPKEFIKNLISGSIQKDNTNIEDLDIDVTDAISPFVTKFNQISQKDPNKTIDFEADEEARENLISELLDLSIKADPINKVFLSDSRFFCDFAKSKNAKKGIKNYLQFNEADESIDEFHKRQFEITKDYSEKRCEPVLEKISSLICGENLPDFNEPENYKDFLKENYNAGDLRRESVLQFQKNYNPEAFEIANSEIPALAGLNCEISTYANSEASSVNIKLAYVDSKFPNEKLQNSDFLKREMLRGSRAQSKHADNLDQYKGSEVCSDSSRSLNDINIEKVIYAIEIDEKDLQDTFANQLVEDNFQGEIPEEIREAVKKKRAKKNGSVIASENKTNSNISRTIAQSDIEGTERKTTAFSEFSEQFNTPKEDKDVNGQLAANSLASSYIPTNFDDIRKKDIDEVRKSPENLKDYNNWKKEKEANEKILQDKIKNLTADLDRLKNKNTTKKRDTEISDLENEIAFFKSNLDKSKAEKFAVSNSPNRAKRSFVTAKNNNTKDRTPQASGNRSGGIAKSFQPQASTASGTSARRSPDMSSSPNSSSYLVLQEGSTDISSLFTEKIENNELGDIDVKYGANGIPMYVKIPGQTLYVAVSELSEATKKLILSSLSKEDAVNIATKSAEKDNNLGRKIASHNDSHGDVSRLDELKNVYNMQMLEYARETNDARLTKFYLKKIKKSNKVMWKLVKDIR